jgi:hypothetical protein
MSITERIYLEIQRIDLEKIKIAMGCIPGISIPTGIIKFFVYLHRESELHDMANRVDLEKVANSADQAAQNAFKNQIYTDIARLKWYALLQVIPLVGIYFAIAEKELLEKMNFLKGDFNKAQTDEVGLLDVNKPKSKVTKIVVNTPGEFDAAVDKGDIVVICFHGTQSWNKMKQYTNNVEDLVSKRQGATTLIFVDHSKDDLLPVTKANAPVIPTTVIRKNKIAIEKVERFDDESLKRMILDSDL